MPHSLTCLCSECSLQPCVPEFTENTCAERNNQDVLFAPQIARSVGNDYIFGVVYGIIGGILSVLILIWLFGLTSDNGRKPAVSWFRQDLNGFEMQVTEGSPIDPEVVKAVHHFQKYPYGSVPVWDRFDNIMDHATQWLTSFINLMLFLFMCGVVFFFVGCFYIL
ncbi:beta c protein [Ligustrum mosaic virus]|nr:beta c protein [Ligustrum mosaic virus]